MGRGSDVCERTPRVLGVKGSPFRVRFTQIPKHRKHSKVAFRCNAIALPWWCSAPPAPASAAAPGFATEATGHSERFTALCLSMLPSGGIFCGVFCNISRGIFRGISCGIFCGIYNIFSGTCDIFCSTFCARRHTPRASNSPLSMWQNCCMSWPQMSSAAVGSARQKPQIQLQQSVSSSLFALPFAD